METSWADELEASRDVRLAFDPARCDLTETKVGVEGDDIGGDRSD